MAATYEFTADPPNRLLRLVVKGFWTIAAAEGFEQDYRRALQSLHGWPCSYRMIVDASIFDIPPQDLTARFRQIATDPTLKARYAAVITHSALLKMQMARSYDDSIRTFSSDEDAVKWLMSLDLE